MAQMTALGLNSLRASVPAEHHAEFDRHMASFNAEDQHRGGTFIDIIRAMFGSIKWSCVFKVLPQAIAAFSNPALWLEVLAAYAACAGIAMPTAALPASA